MAEIPEAEGFFTRNTLQAAIDLLFDPEERARLMLQRAASEVALTKMLYREDYFMNGSSSEAPKIRYVHCRQAKPHPAHYWSTVSEQPVAEHRDDSTPHCKGTPTPRERDDKAAQTRGKAREVIMLNYPETGDPGTRERLLDRVEREAVQAVVAELRTRFANFDIRNSDLNSFAAGWMGAADYLDPDHHG